MSSIPRPPGLANRNNTVYKIQFEVRHTNHLAGHTCKESVMHLNCCNCLISFLPNKAKLNQSLFCFVTCISLNQQVFKTFFKNCISWGAATFCNSFYQLLLPQSELSCIFAGRPQRQPWMVCPNHNENNIKGSCAMIPYGSPSLRQKA